MPEEILGHLKVAPRDRDNGRLEKLAAHVKGSDPAYARVLDEQRRTREERDAVSRSIPKVMVMEDLPKPRDTFILSRGSYLKPGAPVAAAVRKMLSPTCIQSPDSHTRNC